MLTLPRLKYRLLGFIRARRNASNLREEEVEDRYLGISSVSERLDGRLAREEYYKRLSISSTTSTASRRK